MDEPLEVIRKIPVQNIVGKPLEGHIQWIGKTVIYGVLKSSKTSIFCSGVSREPTESELALLKKGPLFSKDPPTILRKFIHVPKAIFVQVASTHSPDRVMGGCLNKIVRVGCTVFDPIFGSVDVLAVQGERNSHAKDVLVVAGTRLEIVPPKKHFEMTLESEEYLDDVSPLLLDLVHYPLLFPKSISKMGFRPLNGILLSGPPGIGKTRTVRVLAKSCHAHLVVVNGPELFARSDALDLKFRELKDHLESSETPCIFFLDEMDSIGPKNGELVPKLLAILDACHLLPRVLIMAATNRPDDLDPLIRRPGRFDRDITLDAPNQSQRYTLLLSIFQSMSLKSPELHWLSTVTNGYVAADLVALAQSLVSNPALEKSHLQAALAKIVPSLKRSTAMQIEPVLWSDIGGLESVKLKLKQAVEWPLTHADTFARLGLIPPHGILLYGPPGCSKTTFAKVIATTTSASFFSLNGASLFSAYVGEAERTIRDLFRRARSTAPSVIFLDEVDALVGKRALGGQSGDSVQERVLSALLNEMDGIESAANVLVLGATNRPDRIDAALLRPGRFDHVIHIPAPDLESRLSILKVYTQKMPHTLTDAELTRMAQEAVNYSGADLKGLCHEAAFKALRTGSECITLNHFEEAFKSVPPSLTLSMLQEYQGYQDRFGSD